MRSAHLLHVLCRARPLATVRDVRLAFVGLPVSCSVVPYYTVPGRPSSSTVSVATMLVYSVCGNDARPQCLWRRSSSIVPVAMYPLLILPAFFRSPGSKKTGDSIPEIPSSASAQLRNFLLRCLQRYCPTKYCTAYNTAPTMQCCTHPQELDPAAALRCSVVLRSACSAVLRCGSPAATLRCGTVTCSIIICAVGCGTAMPMIAVCAEFVVR